MVTLKQIEKCIESGGEHKTLSIDDLIIRSYWPKPFKATPCKHLSMLIEAGFVELQERSGATRAVWILPASKIPYVHVDYNTCPLTVAWVRVTPSGRESKDWHVVTIKRYKKGDLVNQTAKTWPGREYVPTRFHSIRTRKGAILAALEEDPPRKLKAREGKWSAPLFREFVAPEAKDFPNSFIATNSGALS